MKPKSEYVKLTLRFQPGLLREYYLTLLPGKKTENMSKYYVTQTTFPY
jgi:hypothetical protein